MGGDSHNKHSTRKRTPKHTHYKMKKVIVIGATSGLGREMAAQLVKAGYKVGIAGRRSELLDAFVEEYKGVAVEPIEQQVVDITATSATTALDQLIERMGGMDILLHVAGAGFENPTLEEGKERHITEVNSVGFVTIIDHAYHWFRTHGGVGHIAAVTSIAGTKGMGLAPAYSATKRLQTTYLSALAQHARMDGVRLHITDIRPGYAQTDILTPGKKYPAVLSPEKVARVAIKAIKHHRRICTIDWRFKLVVAGWSLVPRPLWERITFVK